MADSASVTTKHLPEGPPAVLPVEADRFWAPPANLDVVEMPIDAESIPALRRLGPLPFPRGGFPLMGFLATVYDHVADHAGDVLASGSRRSP
jgi:hypothetical protein